MLDIGELSKTPMWIEQLNAQMDTHPWRYITLTSLGNKTNEKYRPVGQIVETVPRVNLSGTQLEPKNWMHPWRTIKVNTYGLIVLQRQDPRLPARKFKYSYPFAHGSEWGGRDVDVWSFTVRDYKTGNMDPCGQHWIPEDEEEFSKLKRTQRGRRKLWLKSLEEFIIATDPA